ncbi:putative serine/threonine-protein kinase [Bacillus freudenreichii]|nr:putative serine/threonine-protein kinase [Bacillus freudenreichii]
MDLYNNLAESVEITYRNKKPVVIGHSNSLLLVGMGRSAFVFKIKDTNKAIKVFFPDLSHIAREEASVYKAVQHIDSYPAFYEAGQNYIVIDFVNGYTFFDCLTQGIPISEKEIRAVDFALSSARKNGLNPSDIHLRNIFKTQDGEIKIIDVARFRQKKKCNQWDDLKNAFYHFYIKPFFPKKLPPFLLNGIAFLYKNVLRKQAVTE